MKNVIKYILIAIPVILLGVGATFYALKYPTATKLKKYEEHITQGNSLFTQNEYTKALNEFNDAAVSINTKKDAYEGIAKVLISKNQLNQLSSILDKTTLKLSSVDRAYLYSLLGEAYLKQGQNSQSYELGLQAYKKALELDSSSEIAKIGVANAYLKLGQPDGSKDYLKDIPNTSSNYAQAYILKLFSKGSNLNDIKEVLNETITTDNTSFKNIITDYQYISKRDATEDLYISVLASKIAVNNGYSLLAVKLLEVKKDNLYEYPDGLYVLSSAYFNSGQYSNVIELLKNFSNPASDYRFYLLAARSYLLTNDNDSAVKNFDLAVASSGNKSEPVYIEYTDFLLDTSQFAKAGDILAKADKSIDANWLDTTYLRMYYLQKNNSKAESYIDKLSKSTTMTDPEKKEFMYWAILQYLETQKTNDATILLSKLKEIDKYNPQYYYLAGKMHLQTANTTEAKNELELAIEYDTVGEVTENAKKLLSRVN